MSLKAALAALASAALAFILSSYGYRDKRLFSTLAATALLSFGLFLFSGAKDAILSLARLTGLGELATTALKTVGVGYVFGIASDVSRELGEGGIASALTVVGRIEIFVTVLPYIVRVVELGVDAIK